MTTTEQKLTLAREALELAKNNHGLMLLTDPPQDAWKARGVDAAIARALAAIATESAPAAKPVNEEWLEACGERAASAPAAGGGNAPKNEGKPLVDGERGGGEVAAPAAGAASIDGPEFQALMACYGRDYMATVNKYRADAVDAYRRIVAHIDADRAQQREAGRQELREVVAYEQRHAARSEMALAEEKARADRAEAAFKNFHRSLCIRFGYVHDERDWLRDQVSLEEHIAAQLAARPAVDLSGLQRYAISPNLARPEMWPFSAGEYVRFSAVRDMLSQDKPAAPTMECPECGTDRLQKPCPRLADECAMKADAHLATAEQDARPIGEMRVQPVPDDIKQFAHELQAKRAAPTASDAPKCQCTFSQRMVGDGCSVCNPEYAKRFAEDESAPAAAIEDAVLQMPEWMAYDEGSDTLTIHGIKYAGELMREFGKVMPLNQPFVIEAREQDGALTVCKLDWAVVEPRPTASDALPPLPKADDMLVPQRIPVWREDSVRAAMREAVAADRAARSNSPEIEGIAARAVGGVDGSAKQVILEALKDYCHSKLAYEDGEPAGTYSLIDLLTPDGRPVSDGLEEADLLADEIYSALMSAAPSAHTTEAAPVVSAQAPVVAAPGANPFDAEWIKFTATRMRVVLNHLGLSDPFPDNDKALCEVIGTVLGNVRMELEKAAPVGDGDERALTDAARDVLAERQRQISAEGWTPGHDDEHSDGQMAVAAGYYALACGYPHERDIGRGQPPHHWPWNNNWWKPKDKRYNLIRAGALILAEIERIDRAALTQQKGSAV